MGPKRYVAHMSAPPGQRYRDDFPRFGLDQFANRVVEHVGEWSVAVGGDVADPLELTREALEAVPRVEQITDFHCVTTWSAKGLRWGGWRFHDVYEQILVSAAQPRDDATYLSLKGRDGYTSVLLLEDALAPDVLLADELDGEPLGVEHGAPLRLVAPKHYGFKNVKHLERLDLTKDTRLHKQMTPLAFMDHTRARVELEERGQLPAWLLRMLYRPLIDRTVRKFRDALDSRS